MDKALNYLALARKARLLELGEEPVGAAARALKARLVIVAADATPPTWRRAKSFVAGTSQVCVKVPYTKDHLGQITGRTSLALAAFTDAPLALAFLQALEQPEQYRQEIESLQTQAERIRQRQKEKDAHKRNVRMGRPKGGTQKS